MAQSPAAHDPVSNPWTSAAAGAAGAVESAAVEPLSPEAFARVAKALADPRRFSILETIATGTEVACQRVCEDVPVAQATVCHHVKELSAAGLVETRRDGQFVYYRFLPDIMRRYLATLATRLGVAD